MTTGPDGWLDAMRRAGSGHDAVAVLGTLARHLARVSGAPGVESAVDERWGPGAPLPADALPSPAESAPDALGWAYEALAHPEQRRRGLHYTPRSVADRLVAVALGRFGEEVGFDRAGPRSAGRRDRRQSVEERIVGGESIAGVGDPPTVCDPACGGGAFLLAAARALAERGVPPRVVVDAAVVGVDLDPVAAAVTATALLLWCDDPAARPQVAQGDALAPADWPHRPSVGFDVVVGNPPFQSQLGSATARSVVEAERLREHLGASVAAYVDTAGLFLLAATAQVRVGGRIVLIQPQSVLAARDTASLRRRLDVVAPLEGLWVCDEPIFAAATRVCAPVLRIELAPDSVPMATGAGANSERSASSPEPATVRRWQGPDVIEVAPAARPAPGVWAALAADLRGIPTVELRGPPLVEAAGATAGFRDEYYGLVPHVREAKGAPDERPLVTSGLIDPGICAWGSREVRFAKARWQQPVVDLSGLRADTPGVARWVDERLAPKVVVATQTRVIEVAVDEEGRWVPSTPLIAVPADPECLWHLAAALSAPPVTAWALRLSAGTALVPDALKLSASQVRQVPSPVDVAAWNEGADAFRVAQHAASAPDRRAALVAMGRAMVAAYAVEDGDELLAWWCGRLGGRGGLRDPNIGRSSGGSRK